MRLFSLPRQDVEAGSMRLRALASRQSLPTRLAVVAAAVLVSAPAAQQARIDGAQLMRDVEVLAADDMEGRRVATPGGARARAYLLRRLREANVQPIGGSHERPFTFQARGSGESITGVNLVGVIPGRRWPDRYIALTAHYDHLGVRNGVIYNGADDNATGVAAVLALGAQIVRNRLDHSILLALTDAEESGLRGAADLVANGPIPASALVLNVNVDMIGRDDGNVLYATGTAHYPFLRGALAGVAQPPVLLRFGHDGSDGKQDWTNSSDHAAFHRAGIPFVYFGVENEAHHHEPTDDASTIQRAFFVGAVSTILTAMERLDRAVPDWPSADGVRRLRLEQPAH